MNKIKIEDIKYNKKKIIEPLKKEDKVFDFSLNKNIDKNILIKDQIVKPLIKSQKIISPKKKYNIIKILFILIFLIGLLFFVSYKFEKTTLIIKQKIHSVNIENKKFISSKEINSKLDFEIMVLSESRNKEIVLTESEEVSLKSKGNIILYNEFSKLPHKVTKDKFLSDENGRSYRFKDDVTIPGYTTSSDGQINPGKIEVEVEAFLPGDVYNGEPKLFKVDDYRNTDKDKKIYGEAKSPFRGGALGLVYKINEESINQLGDYFEKDFKPLLLNKAKAEMPDGYVFYPNSAVFSFDYVKDNLYQTNKPEIEIIGKITIPLFNQINLSNYIKNESFSEFSSEELSQIDLLNTDTLSFKYDNNVQVINKEIKYFSFLLSGQLDFIWNIDEDKIKNKLLGAKRSNLLKIYEFIDDTAVEQNQIIDLKVFPPWSAYLPKDISKIKLIIIDELY